MPAKPDQNKSLKAWMIRLAIIGVVLRLAGQSGIILGAGMIPVIERPMARSAWLASGLWTVAINSIAFLVSREALWAANLLFVLYLLCLVIWACLGRSPLRLAR